LVNTDRAVKLIKDIKNDKKRLFILIFYALGIILILLSSVSGTKKENTESGGSLSEYKRELERELSELCSSVEGAGKCRVSVSLADGGKSEYRGTAKISETPPRVLGVTIVAEGGGSYEVRAALTECMTAMFDIKANRVAVMKAD